jgi:hypothetical protein
MGARVLSYRVILYQDPWKKSWLVFVYMKYYLWPLTWHIWLFRTSYKICVWICPISWSYSISGHNICVNLYCNLVFFVCLFSNIFYLSNICEWCFCNAV